MRPYIVACFMKSVRLHFKALIEDLKATSVVLASIFIFVFVNATICVFVYQSQYAGFTYFDSVPESYYNMLILLTTANFPDIMLPSYSQSYWSSLFFIFFLILGLYFLMSILLANVYMKFNQREEKQAIERKLKQEKYLVEYMHRFTLENDEELEKNEKMTNFKSMNETEQQDMHELEKSEEKPSNYKSTTKAETQDTLELKRLESRR